METFIRERLKDKWVALLLFFLIVFAVYFNSLGNSFIVDDALTFNNPRLQTFSFITEYPFSFIQPLFYFITIKLFGPSPPMFRMVNILFHTATVWLVFLLITKFSNRKVGYLTALMFAVHPVLSESVAWISGGGHVIFSFFLLCSLWFYTSSKKRYGFSILFFLLALLISTKASIFPFILFSYELALSDLRKNWKRLIPFFGLLTIFSAMYYFPQIGNRIADIQQNGNSTPITYDPLILLPYSVSSYLQLIFWPSTLSIYHPNLPLQPLEFFLRILASIGFLGGLIYTFIKKKAIFFWLSFFLISISFTFLPINLFWIVAERYVYFGTIGIMFLVAYLLSLLIKKQKTEILGWVLFILIMIAFSARTIVRNADLKNEKTLWLSTVKSFPEFHQGYYSLGVVYEEEGDLNKARNEYERSIQLYPNNPKAFINLGSVLLKQKKFDDSLKASEQAIKLNSSLFEPYQNVAVVYFEKKQYDKATYYTEEAIKRIPRQSDAYVFSVSELYFNLGSIYYLADDKASSLKYFQESAKFNPTNEKTQQILNDKSLWR